MKKLYASLLLLAATLCASAQYAGQYTGQLLIGEDEVEGNILIFPGQTDANVSFVLPDFSFLGLDLGDIVLIDVPVGADSSLAISGYPLWMGAPLNTRVHIDIADYVDEEDPSYQLHSGFFGDSVCILLWIDVPGLDMIPVIFAGNRTEGNYQPLNPGFEGEWDQVSLTSGKTTINGVEPQHWNSFITGSGDLISAAANNKQLKESALVRPGSTGVKSAVITANVLLGVKANGNITTGRLNGGSMSAADSTLNYNYSDLSDPAFNLPFAGKPDSMIVWVRYVPADGDIANEANVASANAILHTDGYYQEPAINCVAELAGSARQLIHGVSGNAWQRLAIPFTYQEADPAYALITFTTCANPGGGTSAGKIVDSLYIDDVEMIYNAELASFTLDGAAIEWLAGRVASSQLPWSDSTYLMEAEANGIGARTFIGFNEADSVVTVIVAGGDYAANTGNYKTYLLGLSGKMPDAQADPTLETALGSVSTQECRVYSCGTAIFVESTADLGMQPIYTIDGRLVRCQRILAGTNIIPGLHPGMYIVAGKKAIVY